MKYLGGKQRLGKHLSPFLLSLWDDIYNNNNNIKFNGYLEPFCGSLGVFKHMTILSQRGAKTIVGNDYHPDLISMWKEVQSGSYNYPCSISEKQYYDAKKLKSPNGYKAFVGFGMSFGGRYFGAYSQKYLGNKKEDFCKEMLNSLKRTAPLIQNHKVKFTNKSYLSFRPSNKFIYCDPPYQPDLINASTEAAAKSAINSLRGVFSIKINSLLKNLTDLRMFVEACLDFPEEDINFIDQGKVDKKLKNLNNDVSEILNSARHGQLLRDGVKVALIGQPNVGKSSLMNQLAKESKAIVTEIPGTTRDPIKSDISIQGIPIHLTDTAGLRDTEDIVEKLGIEKTWESIKEAYSGDNFQVAFALDDAMKGYDSSRLSFLYPFENSKLGLILQKTTMLSTGDDESGEVVSFAKKFKSKGTFKIQYASSSMKVKSGKHVTIGYDYQIKNNLKLFTYYSLMSSEVKSKDKNIFSLGFEYKF